MSLIIHNSSNVEGRYHYHKKQKNRAPPVSPPPAISPDPEDPTPPPSTTNPPTVPSEPYSPPSVPSDPYPNDPGASSNEYVFDVMKFGAVGDGCADDTTAFREAWKAACEVDSGVVLAPANYCFKITSTIFSGPCKPGLVFQVSVIIIFFFFSF